ncbi:MAG: sigma 54-interacting transcriptional regulator [Blastocatellia bacterium]|nr:sigma 54-interacting transcriptional regulator [Blastocatellia bacterium]
MKVLVVEDDPITYRILETLLRSSGHQVTVCVDAETAWEHCTTENYPMVILDWLLPGMSGVQLCRNIRTLPQGNSTFILMATSKNEAEDLKEILDAGADDFVSKPIDIRLFKVRLTIAEKQVRLLAERRRAEINLVEMMTELEKSRNDLMSILNRLAIGTAITDDTGHLTFISRIAQQLFHIDVGETLGKHWQSVFPLQAKEILQINSLLKKPPEERGKVQVQITLKDGLIRCLEVEVHDDPQQQNRKVFCVYDVSEVHNLRKLLDEKSHFHELLGKSRPMMQIYQQIQDISRLDSTVLIEGETGTGKELVARAIHFASNRKDKPFIALNCAGLTDSLLTSQLFGHKRGAFTGAVEDHRGLFEAANAGTLFLDEIGDIPMNVQTSLLRVLQEREIIRVGESKPRKIDVRILAATHRNLVQEVEKGNFRQDLLYRIRVIRIHLPALRERREDISLLVAAFLEQYRAATGKPVREISNQAMHLLINYHWPGNVRELKSAI